MSEDRVEASAHQSRGETPPAGFRAGPVSYLVLGAIVLVCIATDLFFFNGYYASDDNEYLNSAWVLAHNGRWDGVPAGGGMRLGVVGWCILVAWFCQFDVQVIAASFSILHAALVIASYFLARRMVDARAGLLTAYLIATVPALVVFSTGIFPDLIVALFLVLACLGFSWGMTLRRAARAGPAAGLMFASGAAVGMAYLAKESGLVALPVFFLAWVFGEAAVRWRDRRSASGRSEGPTQGDGARESGRRLGWIASILVGGLFAVGFFAVLLTEHALLMRWTGQSFYRLGWTGERQDIEKLEIFHIDGGYDPIRRFQGSMRALREPVTYVPDTLLIAIAASILAYCAFVRRLWLPLALGVFFYAYLTWGTYSTQGYYPPRLQTRYFIPAFPFLFAVVGAVMSKAVDFIARSIRHERARRISLAALAVAFVLHPYFFLSDADRLAGRLYRTAFVRNVAAALDDPAFARDRIVVSHNVADRFAPMWYRGFPARKHGRRPAHVREAKDIYPADMEDLLKRESFVYLEHMRAVRRTPAIEGVWGIDTLLGPLLTGNPPASHAGYLSAPPANEVHPGARFFGSTEPDGLGCVVWDRREIRVESIATFDRSYKSRTRELKYRLGSYHDASPRTIMTSGHAIGLFRVRAVECNLLSLDTRHLVAPDIHWGTTGRWRHAIPAGATGPEFTREDGGAITVDVKHAIAGTLWVVPQGDEASLSAFLLPEDSFATFEIDLDVDAGLSASLVFDCLTALKGGETVRKRCSTQTGPSRYGFRTGDAPRWVLPKLRVNGQGRLSIKRMTLNIERHSGEPQESPSARLNGAWAE